jgi:hypothetical protein
MEDKIITNYHAKNKLFVKQTKAQIYLKELVTYPVRNDNSFSFHRYYHEEKLVGCMLAASGYDRQPKRNNYINDLLNFVDGCYTYNPGRRILLEDKFNPQIEKASIKLIGIEARIIKLNK